MTDLKPAAGLTTSGAVTNRKPSQPWYGALTTIMIGLMATIVLTYTLLDISWQQSFGAWNYAVVGLLIVITALLMRYWVSDPDRWDTGDFPGSAGRTPGELPGKSGR